MTNYCAYWQNYETAISEHIEEGEGFYEALSKQCELLKKLVENTFFPRFGMDLFGIRRIAVFESSWIRLLRPVHLYIFVCIRYAWLCFTCLHDVLLLLLLLLHLLSTKKATCQCIMVFEIKLVNVLL